MAHNSNCAQAERPRCECDCGGARHGCQGAFGIAGSSAGAVREYIDQRERDWFTRPSRMNGGQAAIGCARADVVHWLHRDRDLLECARTTQERAFEDAAGASTRGMVLRGLSEHLGPQRMREFQGWAGRTHFWCELLAQMACAIAQYERLRARMFRTLEDVLAQGRVQELPEGLRRSGAIHLTVWSAWRYVLEPIVVTSAVGTLATLLARGEVQPLLWPIRVIAVLMCPDASDHDAVRKYCWEPIVRHGSAEVRQVIRARLAQEFPGNLWFPQAGGVLGGT